MAKHLKFGTVLVGSSDVHAGHSNLHKVKVDDYQMELGLKHPPVTESSRPARAPLHPQFVARRQRFFGAT